MKIRLRTAAALTGILLIVVLAVAIAIHFKTDGNSIVESKTEERDNSLPVVLDSIKTIGQWSMLSINTDVEADTVDNGFLGTKIRRKPVRVRYHGTLHYGIDMTELREDWAKVHGDTIDISLPAVKLLDERILDETDVKVIEGSQDFINRPAVGAALAAKAKRLMIAEGDKRKDEARRNAEETITRIFKYHGFKTVRITFGALK